MADQETIDPKLHTLVTLTLTYAEAVALRDCAEVGFDDPQEHGTGENMNREQYTRARSAMKKLREAVEPSACPTYEVFNAAGKPVRVTVPGPECSECGGSRGTVVGCPACCRDCGFPCEAEKDAEGFHACLED